MAPQPLGWLQPWAPATAAIRRPMRSCQTADQLAGTKEQPRPLQTPRAVLAAAPRRLPCMTPATRLTWTLQADRQPGLHLDLRSSIAAAEARLSSCSALLADAFAQPSGQRLPAAATAATLPPHSRSSSGRPAAALHPRTSEAMGDTTPRVSRQPRAAKGGRTRLRVPRLDLDGKLAALAHFSATLDDDLPLSWSLGAHHGATAAGFAGGFAAAALASPGVVADGTALAVGGTGGNGSDGATCSAAAEVAGSGMQISLLSPVRAPTPRRTDRRGRATPGDALERRLARKRHLAAAVEANAALNPDSGRGLAAVQVAAAGPEAAAAGCSRQANDQQGDDMPALSPPAPAAEVAIAAARHAADNGQPGQLQQPLRTGGLWQRMLGGLRGFS